MKLKTLFRISLLTAFFVGMFISPSLHAQDTPTVNKPDTSAITFGKVYNDVKGALSGLANGLKVGAEHVYIVLVRQQVIQAYIYISIGIIGIILWVINIFMIRWFVKEKLDADDYGALVAIMFVLGILGTILFLVGLFNIDVIFTGFANPEYGAIHEILKVAKGD